MSGPANFWGTGRAPLAKECDRCHRLVGRFNNGQHQLQVAKHRTKPGGPWCRDPKRAPGGKLIVKETP